MNNFYITYEHLEQGAWKPNNTTQVNPVPLDQNPIPQYITSGAMAGSLAFTSVYSKEMAGGLLSTDYPLEVPSTRKITHFGLNFRQFIPGVCFAKVARNELDGKFTLTSGANMTQPPNNQMNGSTQLKPKGDGSFSWQIDPDGKGWVDSGYVVSSVQPDTWNVLQTRWACLDGTNWSCEGLKCNQEGAFKPAGLWPLIPAAWTAGCHPQIQYECAGAPDVLTVYYQIQLVLGDGPIPWVNPVTFYAD